MQRVDRILRQRAQQSNRTENTFRLTKIKKNKLLYLINFSQNFPFSTENFKMWAGAKPLETLGNFYVRANENY